MLPGQSVLEREASNSVLSGEVIHGPGVAHILTEDVEVANDKLLGDEVSFVQDPEM